MKHQKSESVDYSQGEEAISRIEEEVMKILMPETCEDGAIRIWGTYTLDECQGKMDYVMRCFNRIAAAPGLNQATQKHYKGLAKAAFHFMDTFKILREELLLQKELLSADGIIERLNRLLNRDPNLNRIRGVFFAVEKRLDSEFEKARHRVYKVHSPHPHAFSFCDGIGGIILGVGVGLFFLWLGYR
jgi:hypothetical protein